MAGQRLAPFLLDTKLLIWLAFDPQHVPTEWIKPLEDRRRPVLVSL